MMKPLRHKESTVEYSGIPLHPIPDFKEELTKSMNLLAEDKRVIFVGQGVKYPGHIMYQTLEQIPDDRKIEMPVAEDFQLGFCTGLALEGYIPVCIYPRMDFLIIAINQLVNHLDKIYESSSGRFNPKVIIRTMVGSNNPLYPGVQHCQDYSIALEQMLKRIPVLKIVRPHDAVSTYMAALGSTRSTLVIEAPPLRRGYES